MDGSVSSNVQGSAQNYGASGLDTSNVTAQASRGFEPSNVKSSVHDFANSSHRTHAHSEHNMSPLCNDVHESKHETLQQTQSHQHTPLLQQVQDQSNVTLAFMKTMSHHCIYGVLVTLTQICFMEREKRCLMEKKPLQQHRVEPQTMYTITMMFFSVCPQWRTTLDL